MLQIDLMTRVNILAKNPNFSPSQIRKSRISSLILSTGKYPNGRNLTSIGAKRRNFDIFVLIKWSNHLKMTKNREEYDIICKSREVLGFFDLVFS